MDTVHKRHMMGAARIGSALVGQQHELFDHALRHTAGALDDIHAAAFLVHDQLGFVGFDFHRAACFAQSQALFVQLGHRGQLSHNVFIFRHQSRVIGAVQQSVNFFINTLDTAADDALDELIAMDIAAFIQLHQAGERQALLPFIEAADAVGKLGGQHGDDFIRVIDGSCALISFLIQRGVRADIVADIRNMNAQLIAAVLGLHQADGVVDILGLGRVDGKDRQTAQVGAVGSFGGVDESVIICVSFGQYLLREFLADITAIQHSLGALCCAVGSAEALGNSAAMVHMALAAVGQDSTDLIPQLCAVDAFFIQHNAHITAAVRLHGKAAVLSQHNGTGKGVVWGGHLHHFTLGAALHTGVVEQFDDDFILRHSTMQGAAGNKDIAGAVIAGRKAEAGRQLDQCAGNASGGIGIFHHGKARNIGTVAGGQHTGSYHAGYGVAQAGIIHLQSILQFTQGLGAVLARRKNIFL